MSNARPIIHCDNCAAICMPWENFCSWCGRERIVFAWQPVPVNSEVYLRREEMRGSKQTGDIGYFLHCDSCYSILTPVLDHFCGFCGKPTKDIAWAFVDYGTPEWNRRKQKLRASSKE